MPNPNLMHIVTQLVHRAYVRLDDIEGCSYDATHDRWIQNLSTARDPQPIVVKATAVNHTLGPLQHAAVVALYVHNGVSTFNSDTFDLAPGEATPVSFRLTRMDRGDLAALYLEIQLEPYPWSRNRDPQPVGGWTGIRLESRSWEINDKS